MDFKELVLSTFYDDILKETSFNGVNAVFNYNIMFSSEYNDTLNEINSNKSLFDTNIPHLIISNKDEFDDLLVEYAFKALTFYDVNSYDNDVLLTNGVSSVKLLLTLLWNNATSEDYSNPCHFLRKRISYFDNSKLIDHHINLYLDSKYSLDIRSNKCSPFSETPFKLSCSITDENNRVFYFPELCYGINDNGVVDIYSLQNDTEVENVDSDYFYSLFKQWSKSGNNKIRNISPSFSVAALIYVAFLRLSNYGRFRINTLLISRWNEKNISLNNVSNPELINEELMTTLRNEIENIYNNINQKLINTFLHIINNCNGINVSNFPYEVDSALGFRVKGEVSSINPIFDSIFHDVVNS